MTSGYELFSRKVLEHVLARGIRSRAHFFQTEIRAYCHRFHIAEAPIIYRGATVPIAWNDLADAFWHLFRLMILRFKGELF
jgi:dolichol-phosphate mannosyltransferase